MRRTLLPVTLAAVTGVIGGCAAPVPEGYVFPTHFTRFGGASALLTGTLVEEDGCLYVDAGPNVRYLVIWPDTANLVLVDGVAVILEDGRERARVGGPVAIGGGEDSPDAGSIGERCPGKTWGGSEFFEADRPAG